MKGFWKNTWKHRAHVLMALPAFLIFLLFSYVPMSGLVLAFKNYKMSDGIYGSAWCGLDNFKFLIRSKDIFTTMLTNTLKFYIIFLVLGTLLNVALAIAIDQLVFKKLGKVMQSIMIIPIFISYAAVTFIVEAYIHDSRGLINKLIVDVFHANGGKPIMFYTNAKYWTVLLTIVKMWNSVGYGSILYMSVLSGIDSQLYEAAEIDGANKRQQIFHITIPALIPMVTVMTLLSVGGIMRSDTGLFYQVTRNSGQLKSSTLVIDSYILGQLKSNANFGMTAAATFFQSVVGLVLILIVNGVVRKIHPENALF